MAIAWPAALALAGCVADTGESAEGTGGADATDDVEEAASKQDVPVALPYAGDFSISVSSSLSGHPFHVNGGAMVTIAAEARWANGTCHISYKVALREFGLLGTTLQEYTYPTGTIHTEHWKVPSSGMYRMQITIGNQTTCLPFSGHASITSP